MKKVKVKYYSELCCDLCNDIIHNHFDCPACNKKYASTSAYHQIEESDTEIYCEDCGKYFNILNINIDELELEYNEKN